MLQQENATSGVNSRNPNFQETIFFVFPRLKSEVKCKFKKCQIIFQYLCATNNLLENDM
jgi:hypothetical protein